jgi:Fur family ferric uptake transcriptional regulator
VSSDYENLLGEFKRVLKSEGQKYTNQRELIIKTLFEHNTHYTPELLHEKLKMLYPDVKIGIATIYRTLNLLESHELVSSISFGSSGKKFELNSDDHHDHMICDSCGEIFEFCEDEIEKLQEEVAQKYGFTITSHTMQLHGICKNCKEKS